jgi:2,5-dihydroxypyridine 5,6-dioxygenase
MRRTPLTCYAAAELTALFRDELKLCQVQPGEVVLVFSDTFMNPVYPVACLAAAKDVGADTFQIVVPQDAGLRSRAVVDAWKAADMVVALASFPWLYSKAHNEALDAGTRTLMVEEPEDVLRRLFPIPEVRQRGEAGARLLAAGRRLRVTSEAGTDLTMDKGTRPACAQYGISDQGGRWDHWPSGLVGTAPIEGSVEGTLVIDGGDAILNLGRHVLQPIRLTIRDGRVVSFEGGAEARLLQQYFEAADQPNAYLVSHIGWGTDKRARWDTISLRFWEWGGIMDGESYYGNMQIAFGANFFRQLGGTNVCNFHIDIPCLNNSFWVDDVQVLDRGRFVVPELV